MQDVVWHEPLRIEPRTLEVLPLTSHQELVGVLVLAVVHTIDLVWEQVVDALGQIISWSVCVHRKDDLLKAVEPVHHVLPDVLGRAGAG